MKHSMTWSALAAVVAAQQTRFIFTYGDSYSTISFNPLDTASPPTAQNPTGNPPYPGTTTCNGPNWSDLLTTTLSPAGTVNWNFAQGGAESDNIFHPTAVMIPDFRTQTVQWSAVVGATKPSYAQWTAANSLFIAWFGINDVNGSGDNSSFPLDQQSYFADLLLQYTVGARRFILTLVPPIERTPAYIALGAASQQAVTGRVANWNALLQTNGKAFAQQHPDVKLAFYDPTPTFNRILDDPTAYGAPDNTCANADGVSCLWWDTFHPGQQIHKAMASDFHELAAGLGFYS